MVRHSRPSIRTAILSTTLAAVALIGGCSSDAPSSSLDPAPTTTAASSAPPARGPSTPASPVTSSATSSPSDIDDQSEWEVADVDLSQLTIDGSPCGISEDVALDEGYAGPLSGVVDDTENLVVVSADIIGTGDVTGDFEPEVALSVYCSIADGLGSSRLVSWVSLIEVFGSTGPREIHSVVTNAATLGDPVALSGDPRALPAQALLLPNRMLVSVPYALDDDSTCCPTGLVLVDVSVAAEAAVVVAVEPVLPPPGD